MTKIEPSSLRIFLRSYDHYVNEIEEQAQQLVSDFAASTEIVAPVHFKLCVGLEWIKSSTDLRFNEDV